MAGTPTSGMTDGPSADPVVLGVDSGREIETRADRGALFSVPPQGSACLGRFPSFDRFRVVAYTAGRSGAECLGRMCQWRIIHSTLRPIKGEPDAPLVDIPGRSSRLP